MSYRYKICTSWFNKDFTELSADACKCPLYFAASATPEDPLLNFRPLDRDFYAGGYPAPPW